jgi:hypothetical protein
MPTVINEFGTYEYIPTLLEEFVEKLAKEWDVKLSELTPHQSTSHGPFLQRDSGDSKTVIRYIRNPSDFTDSLAHQFMHLGSQYLFKLAPHLYADNEPGSELAYLYKDNRTVTMEFISDGLKTVSYWVPRVVHAITEAKKQSPIYGIKNEDGIVKLEFSGSSDNGAKQNPIGDVQNAFNVVEKIY